MLWLKAPQHYGSEPPEGLICYGPVSWEEKFITIHPSCDMEGEINHQTIWEILPPRH